MKSHASDQKEKEIRCKRQIRNRSRYINIPNDGQIPNTQLKNEQYRNVDGI